MSVPTKSPSQARRAAARSALKRLVLGAMLAAMSVVIGMFCKSFLNFGGGLWRITFENLPIIFGGIGFGPFVGAMIAVAADLCSCLFASQGPNPLILVGSISVGLVSGIVGRYLCRGRGYLPLLTVELCAHGVGSMVLKTLALHIYYGHEPILLLPRFPIYLCIIVSEAYLLSLLFRHRQVQRLLERMRRK